MIVVDTSALIAILAGEPEHQAFLTLLDGVERRLLSALTYFETGIVMRARAGAGGVDDLSDLLQALSAEIVPFDEAQAPAMARELILMHASTLAIARPTH
jgi:ribonuclease VapC